MLVNLGSVNPRVTDDLYAVLFPAGYLSILINGCLLAAGTLLYVLSVILFSKHGNVSKRKPLGVMLELLFMFMTGILVTPLALAYFFHIEIKSGAYIRHVLAGLGRHPSGLPRRKWIAGRAGAILLAILWFTFATVTCLLPVGMPYVFTGYGYIYHMLLFFACATLVVVAYVVKKPSRMPCYKDCPVLSRNQKAAVLVVTTCIMATFLPVFLFSTVFKVHAPPPGAPTAPVPTSLSIMTYNIRLGVARESNPANNWENRRDEFAAYVDSFNPDILCVQEAYNFQLDYIKDNLHSAAYVYTGFGRDDGIHVGEHAAIFFDSDKYRFIDGDTFWLSDWWWMPSKTWRNGNYRVCTWARLEAVATGAQFCVFNTHYEVGSAYAYFHENASRLIKQKMEEHAGGLPAFLTGDFNMRNTTTAFALLLSEGTKPLHDAYTANETASFNSWTLNPAATCCRIDFILVSSGVTTAACWIPKDAYGDGLTYSDHYPVVANCTF